MSAAPETLSVIYESEEACSYLTEAPYQLHAHDHSKTMSEGDNVAWWECEMTLDDTPVRDILVQSEAQLTETKVTYKPVVRGAALTHAWLCASALGDTFVDFHKAAMQVDHGVGNSLTVSADEPMVEHATFQAFFAQIARQSLSLEGDRAAAAFVAGRSFCRGTLDMSISVDHVDKPGYENNGIYTFTPERRMVIFGLKPGLEIWWRPEIGRIKVERQRPASTLIDKFLEAGSLGDPYDITSQLLGTFVLNKQHG